MGSCVGRHHTVRVAPLPVRRGLVLEAIATADDAVVSRTKNAQSDGCWWHDRNVMRHCGYELLRLLSKHADCEVWLAARVGSRHARLGTFTLKMYRFETDPTHLPSEVYTFERLVRIARVSEPSPYLPKLVELCYYEGSKGAFAVLECFDGKTLQDVMQSVPFLPERTVAHIIRHVLLALDWMHNHGLLHCDIKLEHIMWNSTTGTVTLVDLGHALDCPPDVDVVPCVPGTGGTALFIAPEVVDGYFSQAADAWSVGICMFSLLCGTHPMCPVMGNESMEARHRHGISDYTFARLKCSAEAYGLVKSLLATKRSERMSVSRALEHPFLREKVKAGRQDTLDS